jgi:hypothetical protein
VSVPTLVGVAATHHVGSISIVLVTHGFVAASCAGVMLAALMAMRPTVVARERCVGGPHWTIRVPSVAAGGLVGFALARASASFLMAAVSMVTKEKINKFDAISCWRTVVLLAAARARLLRSVPRWSMVAAGAGVTAWALPNEPPTPDA